MKRILIALLSLASLWSSAHAADLLQVYQQALESDPVYHQNLSQQFATKEGVPISLSALLPNINVSVNPSVTRTGNTGAMIRNLNGGPGFLPRNNTNRSYNLQLSATQTIFNFSQFSALLGSRATAKGADAAINAALQDLMVRVANAYFDILQEEEELVYSGASKQAFAQQLNQVNQQYKVGLKTATEFYTAQSSYETSVANYIATETRLKNARENLRVITGKYYSYLSSLSTSFPLVTPKPQNIDKWVDITLHQNWDIKSAQYQMSAARENIRQQFGGHLPTVSLEGSVDQQYSNDFNNYSSLAIPPGATTQNNRSIMLNIAVPIYSGGNVTAETNKAAYEFDASQQSLERTTRSSTNQARQSYLNIISLASQIAADKAAIKSAISAYNGMEAGYQVGTETLVDVLNQREKVFLKQTAYARDRYQFVKALFALKQAAGTLSFDDLRAINGWLMNTDTPEIKPLSIKKKSIRAHKKQVRQKVKTKKKLAQNTSKKPHRHVTKHTS